MQRIGGMPGVLALAYAIWALFIYFGLHEHEWWPLPLFFTLFPFGYVVEWITEFADSLIVPSSGATAAQYLLFDRVAFAIYFFGGVCWAFFVGYVIKRVTRVGQQSN